MLKLSLSDCTEPSLQPPPSKHSSQLRRQLLCRDQEFGQSPSTSARCASRNSTFREDWFRPYTLAATKNSRRIDLNSRRPTAHRYWKMYMQDWCESYRTRRIGKFERFERILTQTNWLRYSQKGAFQNLADVEKLFCQLLPNFEERALPWRMSLDTAP